MFGEDSNKIVIALVLSVGALLGLALVDLMPTQPRPSPLPEIQAARPLEMAQLHSVSYNRPYYPPSTRALPHPAGQDSLDAAARSLLLGRSAGLQATGSTLASSWTRPSNQPASFAPGDPASSSRPVDGPTPVYLLPAFVPQNLSRASFAPSVYTPTSGTAGNQEALESAGPSDRWLPLTGDPSLSLAYLHQDQNSITHDGLPAMGVLSGVRGLWLYDIGIYNSSTQPIWIIPYRLTFEDGSAETLFPRTIAWVTAPGPQERNYVLGGAPTTVYTPQPGNSLYVELAPRAVTRFLVFAENGGAVQAAGESRMVTAIPTSTSLSGSLSGSSMLSGNLPPALPAPGALPQSSSPPAIRPRFPQSIQYVAMTQPGMDYVLPDTGSVADRLQRLAVALKSVADSSAGHMHGDIPATPETSARFSS